VGSPETWLYAGLTEFLSEWAQTHLPQFEVVRLVGPRYAPEAHHLRDFLDRNPVRYGFYADDSEDGRRMLQEHGLTPRHLPAAILADGRVLPRPSGAEMAAALGAKTHCPPAHLRKERISCLTTVTTLIPSRSGPIFVAS
jgi:thioredoxin reductase (NADPH)